MSCFYRASSSLVFGTLYPLMLGEACPWSSGGTSLNCGRTSTTSSSLASPPIQRIKYSLSLSFSYAQLLVYLLLDLIVCPRLCLSQPTSLSLDRRTQIATVSNITITTYTMVAFGGKRSAESLRIMNEICSREWGLLILDEVHVVPASIKISPLSKVRAISTVRSLRTEHR